VQEPQGGSPLGKLLVVAGASLMVSSILYVWAFVAEFILPPPLLLSIGSLLQYIATYRTFFVLSYALFTIANGLSIVGAFGLYALTKARDASYAALGAGTLVVGLTVALLSSTAPALIHLSDGYVAAADAADQQAYATAALGISSTNNPLIASSFIGVGVIFLSLAMLKGPVARPLSYLGFVVGALNVVRDLPVVSNYPFETGAVFVALSSIWIFGVGRAVYKEAASGLTW